jgi:hypothetical protein
MGIMGIVSFQMADSIAVFVDGGLDLFHQSHRYLVQDEVRFELPNIQPRVSGGFAFDFPLKKK